MRFSKIFVYSFLYVELLFEEDSLSPFSGKDGCSFQSW